MTRHLAGSVDDALASAIEAEALAEAAATRARRRVDAALVALQNRRAEADVAPAVEHMTRIEYAQSRRVSPATVTRWLAEGMPSIPVGTSVRIEPLAADEWRRNRGRSPTRATPRTRDNDTDVSSIVSRAGLRLAGGSNS